MKFPYEQTKEGSRIPRRGRRRKLGLAVYRTTHAAIQRAGTSGGEVAWSALWRLTRQRRSTL